MPSTVIGCLPASLMPHVCPRRFEFRGIAIRLQESCQENFRDGTGKRIDANQILFGSVGVTWPLIFSYA
ncbi:hypothetical protein, partial [Massilia brevitalea]|uniref:hypothetical protein n=1 Tax=Massilia brevitalea TaxID=442526 RepID=UPI002738EEB6